MIISWLLPPLPLLPPPEDEPPLELRLPEEEELDRVELVEDEDLPQDLSQSVWINWHIRKPANKFTAEVLPVGVSAMTK